MDNEKVKNFLLETVVIQNKRTIESQIVYVRNCGFIFLILCLTILFRVTFNIYSADTTTRIFFSLTILLTIIIAKSTLKKHQNQVKFWKIEDDSISSPHKDRSLSRTAGGIGAAIAILLVRNINFSDNMLIILITVISILISLFSVYGLCMFQYKLYLLKKYCPEIKDLKATDI